MMWRFPFPSDEPTGADTADLFTLVEVSFLFAAHPYNDHCWGPLVFSA
jgi:hypothetical protein